MKNLILTFFLVYAISMQAQSAFRIKVVDAENMNPIEKALVYIEEIPLPDQETDINGFVTFRNVPEDRKVKLNVRKKGFVPFLDEVVANRTLTVDNYKIIKLSKESSAPQVIIYGEVTDKNGDEIEGANVEVTVLGKPFTSTTDKSGNYQIKIDGNTLKSVPTFQIEAKKTGCERFKISESVPKNEIINKDIVLQCNSLSNQPKDNEEKPKIPPILDAKKDKMSFKLLDCKQTGQTIKCRCQVKSDGMDVDFSVMGQNHTRIFDASNGREYNTTSMDIGGKTDGGPFSGAGKTVIDGYPVEMIIEFGPVQGQVKLISKLEMEINQAHTGTIWNKIDFRNIPVK